MGNEHYYWASDEELGFLTEEEEYRGFLTEEQYIWDEMDEAAAEQDWEAYEHLMNAYAALEDKYS